MMLSEYGVGEAIGASAVGLGDGVWAGKAPAANHVAIVKCTKLLPKSILQ